MNGFNFTERVRKVLAMAREEAADLHHSYVGPEHMLLGVIREGQGVAATALLNLHVELDALRQAVEEEAKKGSATSVTGPDLPYTAPAKKVLELAMREAKQLNHNYVGTEHLLLGLLAEGRGIAAQVLNSFDVTLETVRAEGLRILGTEMPRAEPESRGATAGQKPAEISVIVRYPDGSTLMRQFSHAADAKSFLSGFL